jgi:hypothetical protein
MRPPGAAIGADHLGQFAYATGPEQSYERAWVILTHGAWTILPNGARAILPSRAWTILTYGAWTILPNGARATPRNGARAALHNPALSPSLRRAGRSVPGTERAIDPAIAARMVEPCGAVPNAS